MTTNILPPRYREPERIGYGGMGDIYRATDSLLGREVAIKVLAERYAEDDAVRQRFTREALAAARLSGEPNIVTIFDVGEHESRPYIVMEYLAGGSLDDVLREEGAQPPQQAFTWLEQAGRALDTAHARGVVHRDVKPGNLLLDRQRNVHVADFGIASAAGMDSLTMTGTVLGTAGYLSPEQAQGDRATPASDRYGLAVVAFELLTGTRPFEADSPTAEAAAHVNAPVPSISARADLPREIDRCFARALAKDPAERFESCADFVAALRAAFADAAGQTRQFAAVAPTVATRPLPARRSSGAWPVLGALLLVGAVAGALLAYFLTRGDSSPTTAPTTVVTHVQTVTTQGQVRTVDRRVTVTTSQVTTAPAAAAPPPTPTPTPSASGSTGEQLNDAGYARMQAGDYSRALPLLEQSVRKLNGTGKLYEAFSKYNLAYTRFHLGNCTGVLDLLDQAEAIEGRKSAIDRLRAQAQQSC